MHALENLVLFGTDSTTAANGLLLAKLTLSLLGEGKLTKVALAQIVHAGGDNRNTADTGDALLTQFLHRINPAIEKKGIVLPFQQSAAITEKEIEAVLNRLDNFPIFCTLLLIVIDKAYLNPLENVLFDRGASVVIGEEDPFEGRIRHVKYTKALPHIFTAPIPRLRRRQRFQRTHVFSEKGMVHLR